MKKSTFKTLLSATVLALALAVSIPVAGSVNAQAATKKATAATSEKKAPKLKIGKTYRVTAKKNKSTYTYVKFVVPSTGKYAVTISNMNNQDTSRSDIGFSNRYLTTPGKYYTESIKVKTKGGKTSSIFLCTPYSYSRRTTNTITPYTNLASRTCEFSAKQGQVIYYKNHFAGNGNTYYYTITMKKKK